MNQIISRHADSIPDAALWEYTANRAHFSTMLPGFQTAWDSTSLGELKVCPRKYFLGQVMSLRSRNEATPLTFGIYYHFGLEQYDRFRAAGSEHEEAVLLTVRALAVKMAEYEIEEVYVGDGEVINVAVWVKNWQSDDTKRNWFTCIRAVVWYLDQFNDDDSLKTVLLANGKAAVELSFRMELPDATMRAPEGDPILLCGHMDRVVQFGQQIYVCDRKTTTSALYQDYFKRYTPDNQMSLYTLASRVVFDLPARGVIIDGAQLAVGFTRFQRGFVNRTEHQLAEWVHDLSFYIEQAKRYAEAKYWPHNDKACGLYGGCVFQDVCGKDPAVRHAVLNTHFERIAWNPLQPRGE